MTEAAWTEALQPEQERPRSAPAPRQPPRKLSGAREENYIKSAVYKETERIRSAGEGARNDQLNIAAMALGQLVAGGVLAETEAVRELTDAALAAGLGKTETQKTIASGMKKGATEPRGVPPANNSQSAGYADDYQYDEFDHQQDPMRDDGHEPTDADDPRGGNPKEDTSRRAATVADVIAEWKKSGPLVHEPTGIKQLDDWTGGGPVYGTRIYVNGAPDAGKTAWLVQLAHTFLLRGVAVGILAVDEESGDLVTRLAQRIGYARHHCEARDHGVLNQIAGALESLPLRMYDDSWSIEATAQDLADFAKQRADADPANHPHGPRAMFLVDSVQTVSCAANLAAAANGKEPSEVTAITANVRAIRSVATRHRFIAVSTSEFGRGAYKSADPKQQTSTLASGKWSGAIEYSARILLGLRSVADETDLVEMEVAKNKHGPRDGKIYLRIDRGSQTLSEAAYDAPPAAAADERKDTKSRSRTHAAAAAIVRVLRATPGLGVRELRAAVRSTTGMGNDTIDTGAACLGAALVRGQGARNATPMSIDEATIPDPVRVLLSERA